MRIRSQKTRQFHRAILLIRDFVRLFLRSGISIYCQLRPSLSHCSQIALETTETIEKVN